MRTPFNHHRRAFLFLPAMLATFLLLASTRACGQQPTAQPASGAAGEPANSTEEPPDVAQLPSPLGAISSNIRDVETTRFLEVVEVNFRPGGGIYGDRDAIVWTLRTRRPITARHLEILLGKFSDVRFYDTRRNRKAQLHQTLLRYPSRIRAGAANGLILAAGEYVDVWFHLLETDIRRLRALKADLVELVDHPRPRKDL